eukprot:15479109-Alexandrium_andersonii.AAC.1
MPGSARAKLRLRGQRGQGRKNICSGPRTVGKSGCGTGCGTVRSVGGPGQLRNLRSDGPVRVVGSDRDVERAQCMSSAAVRR